MKKELWPMGMIALALFFIALARGISGDFDVKFTIVICLCLTIFVLLNQIQQKH